MYERISIDPKVCHGQACIRGARIPVHQIVRMLANGDTIEELLAEYPSLEREDILACLDYAARGMRIAENKSKNMPQFGSLDELVEFFDTHDLGVYWDQMPEAHFEVDVDPKKHLDKETTKWH